MRYTYLANKASMAGKQDEAFACTSELARRYTAWPSALANHFILAVNLGKFEEWREAFEDLKKRAPDYAPIYLVEATLAAREKNLPEALRLIREGLKPAPYYVSLRTMEAYFLLQLKRFPETLERTTELVSLFPQNGNAQQMHLFALTANRRLAEAQALLDRLRKEMPEHEKLWKAADQQLAIFRSKSGAKNSE